MAIPKIRPAGGGERAQYLLREYNDNTIRFVLHYPGLVDPDVLRQAAKAVIESVDVLNEGTSAGRGFAVAGGVAKAVADLAQQQDPDREIKTARAEGLRDCRKLMAMAKAGKYKGYLLEGMGCPGGCVAGPGTNLSVEKATKFVEKYSKEAVAASPTDSPYRHVGESLD